MVIVYHGILPYERSRHLGLVEAYARRTSIIYVDPDASGDGSEHALGEKLSRVTMRQTVPGNRFRAVARINRWLGMRRVLRRIRERGGGPIVLVCQQPELLPTLAGLPADLKVYEVRDDYAGFALHAKTARRVARAHRRMLRECDAVWAISQALVEDIRSSRPDVERTYVGVECDVFARALPDDGPAPFRELPHPRVGLVGNLNDRIDWDLLQGIARLRPSWHLTLVGPVYHASPLTDLGLSRLEQFDNVHRLPPVPRTQLAGAIASLDVGLIPYSLNPATTRINPLKLYQYLAAGIPVVATAIPAVAELDGGATVASTAEEFVTAIEAAIPGRHDARACAERRRLARQFDWQVVADRQLEIARAKLDRRA